MKLNKLLLVSIILLAILTFGAVNAADDAAVDNLTVADDGGSYEIASSVEEIEVDGDIATDVSSSGNAIDDNVNDNSNVKLGASSDNDVLSDDYEILTPDDFRERGFDSGTVCTGTYRLQGVFTADEFPSFMIIDGGCVIDASEAEFQDIGIILQGDVQLSGLTLTSSKYLEDVDNGMSPGAIVYVTGDDNIIDGLTVNYAPTPDGDAYGIYVENANNFQLLNSNIQFTGSSIEEYYEYTMRIAESNGVLIEGNTLIANLPILNVDYNKGEPGLQTDLVLNTGLKSVDGLDIINNTFIANVVDRNGDYPTLDCVMMEYCDNVNVIGNTFEESDFITPEGEANYLNVLDMYYSDNVLVKGNNISVETTGGSENAGTSYPVQLTGPYEGVVIDGNNLYANCGGPALGVYSQNYYGDTEITVQNNNIDITGLPTDHSWGLVSGIELQDNVARVYNNTITTKSVTGSFEEGMNLYGISYAQALMDGHNYDIQGNIVVTEGQYAIYLLQAEDTTITDNYLVSSTGEGDDTVYIREASGNTVIENNHGAYVEPVPANVVTQDNFFEFFDEDGFLLDTVEFDELIFSGEFSDLLPDKYIIITSPIKITGDNAVLNNMGISIMAHDVKLDQLTFIADDFVVDEGIAGGLIGADDDSDGVELTNLNVSFTTGAEMGVAIDIKCNDAKILNNTIFFESHVTDDALVSVALQIVDTENVLVDGNNITTKLPCVYVNNYDPDYYMMGSNNVNPVRLKDCDNLVFTNNVINSTTNDYSADYPTIQSIYIIGCSDSLVDHNDIYMIDEMTPAGMDNYLYGINFGHNTNVTFSYNNFIMSTSGGKVAAGTAYAFQGVESEVIIKGNNITSISNGPNLGIYVASMFGGDSKLVIVDNFINVTGYADASHNWALVSGIEIQNGDAQIYNNTIYTYNANEYDDGAYMYGISYAQWMYGDRSFDIQNNTVYTEGKYTISVINATSLNVKGNTLYAHDLYGDDSIDPGECADVTLGDNLPPCLTNIVTQDNFYSFFDEYGNLLESIEFDELIFQGEFSDLASYITIDRALTITGDNAVLNDIGFIIVGEGITLDNMTLVANSDLGNLIDIAGVNAVIKNMNIAYVVDEAASAITVRPYANGVQILNNTIYFESTVDDYAADEVTTAICVNSGVSMFDDEDPIEGLIINGNNITVVIPAFLADVYENEYYVMGLSAVNGVRINGAEGFVFKNNRLDVTTNRLARTTPTLQALYVASSSGSIDGNNISMIDTFTPAGKDVYLYAVELINDEELTISNNNFNLSTTGGKDEAGSAYAILAIASEFEVTDNNITTVSNGPNLGIYFPSHMGAPCDAVISGNFINVTGLATAAHDTGLVSGIEIQTGDVLITDNTIYTYNIGEYDEGNYMYGISYAQDGSAPEVVITDNTIYTEGHYAISFLEGDDATITGNYLISADLFGDGAVEIKEGEGIVEYNLPTNVVTNDTFYNFFDENGILLDNITFDELIFQGDFSDLTDMIVFNRAIVATGENAVLDNIAIRIAANEVNINGFTLNANKEFANNNGALIYATGSDIEISDVVANYVAPSEAEAIAVYANAAENFVLFNSEIIYESTNPGSNHNYGLEVRNSNSALVDNVTINAILPAVPVSWGGEGIDQDLVLAVGIQGGDEVEFTNNRVTVTTNGGIGSYPTVDAVMIHGANDILIKGNNITHMDTTTEDGARYYYSLDIYSTTGTVEANNIIVNTTAGVDRAGTAYPIQLTGPFTVTIKDNNLTAVSKGPIAGIYASNWGGAATLTVENNNIDVAGYATTGNYALVAGIEAEIDMLKAYNNTITVANGADYDDANQVIGVGIGSSYFYGDAAADIKDNTITVDGKYAVYYAKAVNTNVTDNTLYAHNLKGDAAAVIEDGTNNIIENNLPSAPVLSADDLVMTYKDGSAWVVTLTDANGIPIAGAAIKVGIYGKLYNRVTDADGVARLVVNLAPGSYAVNAT
uniref:hypothetical protein n=1 Tax=Methanobrevibacter sp. TaxID=66852 RepID=UPI003864408C